MKTKKLPRPPRLAAWLLSWLLPDSTWHTPLGDFEEYFHEIVEERGLRYARVWFWGQALGLIPDRLQAKTYWGFQMLKNYYITALRNLRKQKGFAAINLIGLALGLACFLLIIFYVTDELTYDRFWPGYDRIYRISINERTPTSDETYEVGPWPLAATLVSDYPEVLRATRLRMRQERTVSYRENQFEETRIYGADSNFFDIFQVPFLQGDRSTALKEPSSVVLTESMALKYFGNEDPIGKVIDVMNDAESGTPYTVTGVIPDTPENAHIRFDIILSWWRQGQERFERNGWLGYSLFTYLVIDEQVVPEALEAKFPEMVRRYAGVQIEEAYGVTYDEFLLAGNEYTYSMIPVKDIHLSPPGKKQMVYLFAAIAVFILLIACINYTILATARSAGRAKEIGIRKVLGSKRKQLVVQVLTESTLMTFMAFVVALILVVAAQPLFESLTGKSLRLEYFLNPYVLSGLLVLVLFFGTVAGGYPAIFLSRFNPGTILKKAGHPGRSRTFVLNSLVVFQFVISGVLLVGTFVVHGQMTYMLNRDLGFDKEQTIIIEKTWVLDEQEETFKSEVLRRPDVKNICATYSYPGGEFSELFIAPEKATGSETYNVYTTWADHYYGQTLGLELVAGRFFDVERATDSSAVIVNETLVATMSLEGDPIGQRIHFSGSSDMFTIIGVVRDFHFMSMRTEIAPFAYFINPDPKTTMLVQAGTDEIAVTLKGISEIWSQFIPGLPFNYSFLDNNVADLYSSEQQMKELFGLFSFLAIVIACLGLFGLSAFIVEKRTKEIGVRKVMGASVMRIITTLSGQYARLLMIALVIATPIAYFGMRNWLNTFAYRTRINVDVFILSGIIVFLVAMITVTYQATRAARTNPVDSLRYE